MPSSRSLIVASVLAVAACSTSSTPVMPDGDVERDAATADGGAPSGDAARDGASAPPVDAAVVDAAVTTRCGDSVVEGAELCDGDTSDCAALTGLFADDGRTAACRADCSGYDVSTCTLPSDAARQVENVFPATRDPRWAAARCNDGTPYRFEVSITGSSQWIINFEGGGACDGQLVPCNDRWVASPWKFGTSGDGVSDRQIESFSGRGDAIMSRNADDNPTLAGANIVIMNYCSSDLWAGARTDAVPAIPGDVPFDLVFAGRLNARATVDILRQRYGLTDVEDVDLVVTGTSAGGNGARINADLIADAFPRAQSARRIWVIPVAGFQPYDWSYPTAGISGSDASDAVVFDAGVVRYGAELSTRCIALAAAEGAGAGACFTGLWGTRALLEPAPTGYGLRVLDATNRTDPVYHAYHEITRARADYDEVVDAWEALMTDEMLESGLRWLLAPAHRTTGGGSNVHGLYEFWTTPFPGFSVSLEPCGTPRGSAIVDFRSLVDAFYRDTSPDTSGIRVCPAPPWPRPR